MNGFVIGTSRIRLSWGRSQADKAPYVTPPPFGLMSPTMTTRSLSNQTVPKTLLGSFKPLSPPQQYYQSIQHTNNSQDFLFKSEDDWLNPEEQDGKHVDDWHINGIYA